MTDILIHRNQIEGVDERYLDVDFFTEAGMIQRSLGCSTPRDLSYEPLGSEIPVYGDVDEVIPMEKWDDIMDEKDANETWLADLINICHDQDGEGSCVAEAFTGMHEDKQVETYGLDLFVPLSAASLYTRTGSSPGSGSTLSANFREMKQRGALPLNTPENTARFKHTHRAVGFRAQLPQGWEETGQLFAFDEYVDIADIEQFGSAILKNQPVGYARAGHCIRAVKMFGRVRNNTLKIGYMNSWSLQWGSKVNRRISGGMGFDSLSTVRRVASGAIALRSIKLPQDLLKRTSNLDIAT